MRCTTVAGAVGLFWIAGCASDNDPVSKTSGAAGRGAAGSSGGGATATGLAGAATAGGLGGDTATGGASSNSGGNAQAGNTQAVAGEAAMTQGGGGRGETSASAGASGLTGGANGTATCPQYSGTGGVSIKPPTNDFESNIDDWTTMTSKDTSLSRKQLANSACRGSSYLACDGATRGGPWDGPKLNLLPFVVVGHQYVVTLAARFDPENAPAAAGTITFSAVNACSDSTVSTAFRNLDHATTLSDWVRLSGKIEPVLTGCSALSEVTIYIETDAITQPNSIDIDDFQLWDVTP